MLAGSFFWGKVWDIGGAHAVEAVGRFGPCPFLFLGCMGVWGMITCWGEVVAWLGAGAVGILLGGRWESNLSRYAWWFVDWGP